MLQAVKFGGSIPDEVVDTGVDSASNRDEYQESSWGGGAKLRPARKADNLTAICKPTV
jgi:hypothetical protein